MLEDINRIKSEDYADFILARGEPIILRDYPTGVLHSMNETFGVVYLPATEMDSLAISRFGYAAIPKLYGLTSDISVTASRVPDLRNTPGLNLQGNGVLMAYIDTGIDYQNDVFKKIDGSTKIVSIWDQTIDSENGAPINTYFGTEYTQTQINEALTSTNPLNIVPSMDDNGHGTALAAIGVGTANPEAGFQGVAPEAEIIVVKLKPAKKYLKNFFAIMKDVPCYQENDIMWGLHYCVIKARELNKPLVVTLGVGSSQGAHDGRSRLAIFCSIVADIPRISIVTSIGNEGNLGRHYFGVVDNTIGYNTVELNVAEGGESFSMELWGGISGIFSIDILSPFGESISRIAPSITVNRDISFIFEDTRIYIDYHLAETETGDQLILMRLYNATPGVWRFNVYGRGDLPLSFHIWLPMGNFISRQTYFIQPDIYTTILAPAAADFVLGITAYNPVNEALFINASRGYTRSFSIRPDVAAPGVNYLTAGLDNEFITYTGTGVAAAHAGGIVALMLEWCVVLENYPLLNATEIKSLLIRGAKRKSNLSYPNREWGYGIIDINRTFLYLRQDIT